MAYGGDVNRGPFLNGINWTFNAIALVTVILRLASHYMLEKQGLRSDDGFIILAMAVNIARSIFVNVCVSMGFGRHLKELLEEDPIHATKTLRLIVALQAIGLWTFTLPKLPVVALLVNLFGKRDKRIQIILYSSVTALVMLVFVMTITTFVQCTPVSAQWTLKGKCWPRSVNVNLGYLAGSYSAFLDFAFALYPVLQISKLQMERSRKVVLASSLSLGFLACITTVYKLTTIHSILNVGDPTWATIPLEVWNSVEGTALIMAASIPLTRPLMILVIQGFRDLTYRITGGTSASRPAKSTQNAPRERINKSNNHRRLGSRETTVGSHDDILLLEAQRSQEADHLESNSRRPNGSEIFKTVDVHISRR
ncbi:hypothetical protein LARI1_G003583 [Lachnellula arida]|uniref:Rhodopsin domain-containing protein n=1 Tax=Lachnellula arida TaxID=1316785 RepID=A0A8T9BHY0_9HELO|nr:hypothetical protein LARI1_G003583 [Lachnellula arida]